MQLVDEVLGAAIDAGVQAYTAVGGLPTESFERVSLVASTEFLSYAQLIADNDWLTIRGLAQARLQRIELVKLSDDLPPAMRRLKSTTVIHGWIAEERKTAPSGVSRHCRSSATG